jgi:hypothetical protein
MLIFLTFAFKRFMKRRHPALESRIVEEEKKSFVVRL